MPNQTAKWDLKSTKTIKHSLEKYMKYTSIKVKKTCFFCLPRSFGDETLLYSEEDLNFKKVNHGNHTPVFVGW